MEEFQRKFNSKILEGRITLEALQLLLTITSNIIEHPSEEKYKSFKRTDRVVKYLENDVGYKLLELLTFEKKVSQMEVKYVLKTDLYLKVAGEILKENIERVEKTARSHLEKVKKEQDENEKRIQKALTLIEDDRRERRDKNLNGGYRFIRTYL